MVRRGEFNRWWRIALLTVGPLLRLALRLRHLHTERVPVGGGAVLAPNHVSMLDGVTLAHAVALRGRETRFLVASEFFSRWTALPLRLVDQIPIRRGTQDSGAIEEAVSTLKAGALAGVFPEGRVTDDPWGPLQPGRTGVGRVALAARIPVIPVGIWGTQSRWPKGGLHFRRPWRPAVTVCFGEPIEPKGDPSSREDLEAFRDLVMEGLERAVSEARADAEGRLRS